jgi:hypothetical protein
MKYLLIMKKYIAAAGLLLLTLSIFAQTPDQSVKKKKDWSKVSLMNRPNDHLMIQIGYEGWAAKPDSAKTKGIPRSLAIYFMFDMPFKTDPRFSIGIGAGISGSNVSFDKTEVAITGTGPALEFNDVSGTNHFKKYKLSYNYLEAPIELRFSRNPENDGKSLKFALGAKIGTLINVHTKGKTLLDANGRVQQLYTEKLNSKNYFERLRMAGTARISLGHIGIFGSYQINNFIKSGIGADIRPFTIGFVASGL